MCLATAAGWEAAGSPRDPADRPTTHNPPPMHQTNQPPTRRTHVNQGHEVVIDAVDRGVDGEKERHQDFVGKHDQRLHHVERVAGKRGGYV